MTILCDKLRRGNRHAAGSCHNFICTEAQRTRSHSADSMNARLVAGLGDGRVCSKLEDSSVGSVMRLSQNTDFRRLAKPFVEQYTHDAQLQPDDELLVRLTYSGLPRAYNGCYGPRRSRVRAECLLSPRVVACRRTVGCSSSTAAWSKCRDCCFWVLEC